MHVKLISYCAALFQSLVNPSDVETVQIEKYFLQRIQEGHGEFVFELGSGGMV